MEGRKVGEGLLGEETSPSPLLDPPPIAPATRRLRNLAHRRATRITLDRDQYFRLVRRDLAEGAAVRAELGKVPPTRVEARGVRPEAERVAAAAVVVPAGQRL